MIRTRAACSFFLASGCWSLWTGWPSERLQSHPSGFEPSGQHWRIAETKTEDLHCHCAAARRNRNRTDYHFSKMQVEDLDGKVQNRLRPGKWKNREESGCMQMELVGVPKVRAWGLTRLNRAISVQLQVEFVRIFAFGFTRLVSCSAWSMRHCVGCPGANTPLPVIHG